jgi:glycosyltransferase involved in cell wall biosynthesis
MSLQITAIVCTVDRPAYLRKAVESLLAQDLPAEAFEVLVVENGAPGQAAEVLKDFLGPRVRLLLEPRMGVSYARNLGWREARSPYVAFLDDDATACQGWLSAALEGLGHPSRPACVGGPIVPDFEVPRPDWLPDNLLAYLGGMNKGSEAMGITEQSGFWLGGGNSACDRAYMEASSGFREGFGRVWGSLTGTEDSQFQKELLRQGRGMRYAPGMLIHHAAPAERLTRAWFEERLTCEGISLWEQDLLLRTAWARGARLMAALARMSAQSLAARFLQGSPAFARRCDALKMRGYWLAALGRRRA